MLIASTAGRSDTMVKQVQITNVVGIKAVKDDKNWVKVYRFKIVRFENQNHINHLAFHKSI